MPPNLPGLHHKFTMVRLSEYRQMLVLTSLHLDSIIAFTMVPRAHVLVRRLLSALDIKQAPRLRTAVFNTLFALHACVHRIHRLV
jgi:hypothetical protein